MGRRIRHAAPARTAAALLAAIALNACSLAPPYQVPPTAIPTSFKESGPWQPASPADRIPRNGWWKIFDDAQLDALEAKVDAANPDVAAAVARHDKAQALVDQTRAGLYPSIGADLDAARARQSDRRPLRGANEPDDFYSNTFAVSADFDLDLWGKVRNEVSAGVANAQASADDLASLQLDLQANLADDYFTLRGFDEQQQLLADAVATYQRALTLTTSRHHGGIASGLDVSRARTQLQNALAAADDTRARRALLEHAIATLTGTPASSFTLAADTSRTRLPSIPTGVPAALLQRRPDIAAAERRVAAANAQIGVAKAAYYPDISLDAQAGYQTSVLSPWFIAPDEIWSIGPNLALTLFDAGRRRAITREARAQLAQNGAQYKATVLLAFQQVEDNLALLHHLGDESVHNDAALDAAQRTLTLATSRYKDGVVSYLDVVTAQTAALDAQIASAELDARRLTASVGLIQALGGGWQDAGSDPHDAHVAHDAPATPSATTSATTSAAG
ncbi:efflux transporter outer membrane subunit [Paraburkholderia solisilvae]|uniref:Outer membrane protein OprM n=1 Tax=Paraburkholderia solisilvae TaxID=624376 RepID=A0A6J5DH78_9BURK|nr:efflux transporter outer membrane subunit [Paraburkholderia solisilvae]CAB3753599.1 Outer membrane protein OprM [Paraburkholderia solisilvae]